MELLIIISILLLIAVIHDFREYYLNDTKYRFMEWGTVIMFLLSLYNLLK